MFGEKCWFCKKREKSYGDEYEVSLHRNPVGTFKGIIKGFAYDTTHYEIRYEPGKTIVPLCKECAAAHKMAKAIIWKSAIVGWR